jgi:predicted porin
MASATFTAPTNCGWIGGSTLTACVINGFNQGLFSPTTLQVGANETHYYVGGTMNTPVSGLKCGLAFDDVEVHNGHGEIWNIGTYVAFQATEKLSVYGRAEYTRQRGEWALLAPMPERAIELTATAQYDLWKNVLSRVEFRWDRSVSGTGVWGDNADLKNEFVLLANLVYKF